MELQVLSHDFSVCKVVHSTDIDLSAEFCFVGKTDEEISLVCKTQDAPAHCAAREDGWKALRISGVLDFSLIGILSGISAVLARHGIGIFVVSTYNTDYILVKADALSKAIRALEAAGYVVSQTAGSDSHLPSGSLPNSHRRLPPKK